MVVSDYSQPLTGQAVAPQQFSFRRIKAQRGPVHEFGEARYWHLREIRKGMSLYDMFTMNSTVRHSPSRP